MLIPLFEGSLKDRGRIKDLRILGFLTRMERKERREDYSTGKWTETFENEP